MVQSNTFLRKMKKTLQRQTTADIDYGVERATSMNQRKNGEKTQSKQKWNKKQRKNYATESLKININTDFI